MSDIRWELAHAFEREFAERLASRVIPFSEAVPIEAMFLVLRDASAKGWGVEKTGDLDGSMIYRFTPPDWTPERAALLARVEGEAA